MARRKYSNPHGFSMVFERPDWDEYFMMQAELAKLRSNCMVRKIGTVIAKDHRQLATGYNGTPPGMPNCYEGGCERCAKRMAGDMQSGTALDRCMCNHAEANAIIHCAILGVGAVSGATLYCTATPCLDCSTMAITVGIRRFVCISEYSENAKDLTDSAGVDVVLMDPGRISKWLKVLTTEYEEQGVLASKLTIPME